MQWNARSAVSNKNSLSKFLSDMSVDIALISETWFKPESVVKFKDYNIIRQDRFDGKAGVAVLIKKHLGFKVINFCNNFNEELSVCGARISINGSDFCFLSIYKPPKVNTNGNDWNSIFSQATPPCVIGGDFNAHNALWGSSKNDNIGNQILNVVDNLGLVILNNGNATRLQHPSQEKSVVDITMSSSDLANKISWDTYADTLGSDHFPITMEISIQQDNNITVVPKSKWNLKKANWSLYSSLIEQEFLNLPSFSDVTEKYVYLLNSINTAASLSIPTFKPYKIKSRLPPPWWDENCDRIVLERKKALETYKQSPTEENFLTCKKTIAQSKRTLKAIAKQSWRDWCSNLNKNIPPTLLWKQAKKMQRIPIKNKSADNDLWLDDFFNKVAPPTVNNMEISNGTVPSSEDHFLNQPFQLCELNFALKNTKTSSAGYDDIKYPMLQHLPNRAKVFLLEIFNAMYLAGDNINHLKNIVIIPILKPGKDPNSPDSYRPISLLSCILKIFERLIRQRLEWWLLSNNFLPFNQFGFRKGYGTVDAVLTLTTDIQMCYSRNNYLCALFLDIQGAYESVNLKILENKLADQFSIPKSIAKSICNLYSNRLIYIRNSRNVKIGPRTISSGLPQGSVLSPLLFNLYTVDFHQINTQNLKIVQYADDFCIYTENRKWEQSLVAIEDGIRNVSKWLFENGLELSSEKSTISVFTRHNFPETSEVLLANHKISFLSNVKYLGVILDRRLTWKPFIDSIVEKCNKGINFLKFVTKTWWGADVKTALVFYKSFIRSIIDYGCPLYGSANQSLLNRLDVIQRKALRICLGAMNSTPNDPLYVEALEPPLLIRRNFLCNKIILKQSSLDTPLLRNISSLNIFDLTNKYWEKKPSPPMCVSFRECYDLIENIKKCSITKKNYWTSLLELKIITPTYSENPVISSIVLKSILYHFDNPTIIYTDASKSEEGSGCAFVIPSDNIEVKLKLNNNCSIFTAEAIAIYEALKYIQAFDTKEIVILSDSLSVLKALNNICSFSVKTNPYIIKIKHIAHDIMQSSKKVIFIWIKAHIGLIYNERADTLAKEAIKDGIECPNHTCLTDNYVICKDKAKEKWKDSWKQFCSNGPTSYCRIQPIIPHAFWHNDLNASRKYVTTLIRVRFGHACYPAHLHKIGVLPSENCPHCGIKGDLNHIFFGCTNHINATTKLIKNVISNCNTLAPFCISNLLSLNSKSVHNSIIAFLDEVNIKL